MNPVIEIIEEVPPQILGESPHWDVKTQSLYFVDIIGKSIHKYTPSTRQHAKATLGNPSFIIPIKTFKDKFVVSQETEIVTLNWDGVSEKVGKVEELPGSNINADRDGKFNDGKCDSLGRLWIGTIGMDLKNEAVAFGKLYSYQHHLKTHLENVSISNGMAWNDSIKKFYYIDSMSGCVDEYDFDLDGGSIIPDTTQRKRIFITEKVKDLQKLPDGMTLDTDGNIWVAVFGQKKIVKINPNKPEIILQTIEIPVKQVTAMAWGGPDLDVLFVTTGNTPLPGYVINAPGDGCLYKITQLGARGLPPNDFVLYKQV
ncbi:regucalcin-like [Euwallacea fornicatus]|uniref:regucalcin-like n=1 Tax=Euwallacea fornicatus TaxID=995702 RepID=UPI00338E7546